MRFLNWLLWPTIVIKIDIEKFYDSVSRADKDLTRCPELDVLMAQIRTRIVERFKDYEYTTFNMKVVK